jgi:uncharacterized membrane protein
VIGWLLSWHCSEDAMLTEKDITIRPEPPPKPAPPIFPTNSVEFVNALSHYYRGEMSRMMSWRDRLDRTTNWAIAAVAAMLSISLSSPESHHGLLLFAMVLVFLLLIIESRRYRFFHVYRSRVRLIERNYYTRLFAPREMVDPSQWMAQLGEDLRLPRFSMTLRQAMARRLRRNYFWLFLILLMAWLLKTTTSILQPRPVPREAPYSISHLLDNAAIGYLPGWMVLIVVLAFYGWMSYTMYTYRETSGELAYGEVHV